MLSVVVCTCNRLGLLKETLATVLEQKTDFDMEVIVSDDHSSDSTIQWLAEMAVHDDRLCVIFNPENLGIGANWASAMKRVRGKYVAFLDDDDLWTDTYRMQRMVEYLEHHPTVDVVYTDAFMFDPHSGKRRPVVYPHDGFPDLYRLWTGTQSCVSLDVCVIRTATINRCVNYDDYIRLHFPIQDWNTHILLSRRARYAFIDYPSCEIRATPSSLSRMLDYDVMERKYRLESAMCTYLASCFSDDDHIVHEQRDERYMNHVLASVAFRRGDWHRAKRYSRLSGRHGLREWCSRTWISFHLFRIAKHVWGWIRNF